MNVKRRGLGRGLDALLGARTVAPAAAQAAAPVAPAAMPVTEAPAPASPGMQTLPVDVLTRGRYQPRSDMRPESLQDLADSITA